MPKDEIVIQGWSTSGMTQGPTAKPKLAIIRHYETSWEVHVAIANPLGAGNKRYQYDQALAALKLEAGEAMAMSQALAEFSRRATEAKTEATHG